jgi:hypothetical protein
VMDLRSEWLSPRQGDIDFSTPLACTISEPSPGAGRPGGVPFDDLYEVIETGDALLPRCVRSLAADDLDGFGELDLSIMHSHMQRYRSISTCRAYEQGQRLFYSSPFVREMEQAGYLRLERSTDEARLLVATMLERDLSCRLTAAPNEHAFFVEPGSLSATAVKRILYGLCVGISIMQAFDAYPHANPMLQDHLPPAVRFAQVGSFGTKPGQEELRKMLYGAPRYFIVPNIRWNPAGRTPGVPMREAYKAALLAGWHPGHLAILRALIESGARMSEVLAVRMLDWLRCSDGGVRCDAINKGSRGQIWKEIGFTPDCAADWSTFVDDHRHSPVEFKKHGRRLRMADYRQMYADGRLDDLKVPIFTTRLGGGYTRDGFYNHVFSPTLGPLGVRGHDPRREFVSVNLDRIYARFWNDKPSLDAACQRLIDYMGWATGEAMLFLYSRRHRQKRDAIMSAAFHQSMIEEEAAKALSPGVAPLPSFFIPNAVSQAFDDWMSTP